MDRPRKNNYTHFYTNESPAISLALLDTFQKLFLSDKGSKYVKDHARIV